MAKRWVENRHQILKAEIFNLSERQKLRAYDEFLRQVKSPILFSLIRQVLLRCEYYRRNPTNTSAQELQEITDETVFRDIDNAEVGMGRWTAEDPNLRTVQRWLRARPALS